MRIEEIHGLFDFLEKKRKIVITNHINPDGDAMGSALAMSGFLKKCGHECYVIVPNDYPNFLNWMSGSDEVIRYTSKPEMSNDFLAEAELVIVLDYNTLNRSGDMEKELRFIFTEHMEPQFLITFLLIVVEPGLNI